ncbi:MAG TPA: coenzyme F420 hydrogenase [Muricauda sp.]|uniref:Coenzyme F420 hydrogenase/dehydrogenase, beta subunit C-terminal domain n=1 Tax=Flagellimonas aurea TaxID=2915619 RepID=A0ABS3G1V9_9FLAO|nr:Coenzyme F420 hydrogenase/dehydrogenase, beta subunit C-terminal domain [Allomuricauda aurea]MAO15879.1 coenzyme F420 hydrogenase [Allomuricauda sp.]MBC71030.1 coenzyme F420 hydrogenase [Allomuricauda sp.]MBO0352826.1 Coenzyme F420 hydrogenase/dehydrogenase, beta subunit C-terminal domain [Allomuricauda aurea]HBU78093.1 coenzyme F420 hydrogenase [Allomuricauda sp.]|tara:strand:+ start:5099 stop:6481 length:1383 start_codon:yes stop_codon:yes gene_type:complete
MLSKVSTKELMDTVVKGGYCSGCGVCTASEGSVLKMGLTSNGNFEPYKSSSAASETHVVCPFANHDFNEDNISKKLFSNVDQIMREKEIGHFRSIYAGFVKEGDYRQKGSSGGGVSWLCAQLFNERKVDFIIHVKQSDNDKSDVFYEYDISSNLLELQEGAKSRYYPITLEKVLERIRNYPGKYAIVGVPCFIKGIQLLRFSEEVFKERIVHTVSIFCGHLKTTHYMDVLLNQFGVPKQELIKFDFRHKIPNRSASDYGTSILTTSNEKKVKLNKSLFGTNWGLNLFKLKACDYCDDVIGETADISFGDAWLPQYLDDAKGTNVIVVRNQYLDELIKKGVEEQTLFVEELSKEDLIKSQAGGFRHRREGLRHRLFLQDKNNEWRPQKRYSAQKLADEKRARIYENRIKMQEVSFSSKNHEDLSALKKELEPFIAINSKLNKVSLTKRIWNKIKRTFNWGQ